jgi:predicted membrane channel-forming protein YqfA (hemolysin III family)
MGTRVRVIDFSPNSVLITHSNLLYYTVFGEYKIPSNNTVIDYSLTVNWIFSELCTHYSYSNLLYYTVFGECKIPSNNTVIDFLGTLYSLLVYRTYMLYWIGAYKIPSNNTVIDFSRNSVLITGTRIPYNVPVLRCCTCTVFGAYKIPSNNTVIEFSRNFVLAYSSTSIRKPISYYTVFGAYKIPSNKTVILE